MNRKRGENKTLLIIIHGLPLVFALVTTPIWTPSAFSQCFQFNSTPTAKHIPELGAWSLTEEVTDTAKSQFFKKSRMTKSFIYPILDVKKTCQILSNNILTYSFHSGSPKTIQNNLTKISMRSTVNAFSNSVALPSVV